MADREIHENGDLTIPELPIPELPIPESTYNEPQTIRVKMVNFLRNNGLVIATLIGIIIGAGLGFGLRNVNMTDHGRMWLGLPGELYLRCLKATIVPLVICMVIISAASLDAKTNGKVAFVALMSFFLTHLAGVIIAIILSQVFKPDRINDDGSGKLLQTNTDTQDVFADLFRKGLNGIVAVVVFSAIIFTRNIFPDNVVGAMITQTVTQYSSEVQNINSSSNATVTVLTRSVGTTEGMNILGLISICTAVGIAAGKSLSPDSEFLRFFRQSQDVIFIVIRWLFWTTPIGVTSLIAEAVSKVDDIRNVFYNLGMLMATVTVGLTIHLFIFLPLVLFIFIRKNPFIVLFRCARPFIIAFAATATSVAIPDMLTSCSRSGISNKISSFVIPMSVTLQADGSALYMAASALFVATTSGHTMSFETMCIVGILTSVLSLAIPPVPSSSIVTLIIILTSVNVPIKGVAILFAVEWILDRYRSGVNAVSHVMVAVVTDAICSKTGKAVKDSENSINKTQNNAIETKMDKENVTEDKTSVS